MKSTILSIGLVLFAGSVSAETLPTETTPKASQQSTNSSQADNGFTYPDITHLESEATVNDVVFFYPSEMLDEFDGDAEKLVNYVQTSVEMNNFAFRRQDIPLRRKVAGVVAIPSQLSYDVEGDREKRLYDLRNLYTDSRYNYNYYYDVSYVVAITPHIMEAVNSIGSAEVGGKFSWISPYNTDEPERTLAHELGHNDGFTHTREEYDESNTKGLRFSEYSNGTSCGSYSSIMKDGSGDRSEGFFSSPLVTNAQGVECGHYDEADSARSYIEAVADHIPNQKPPFSNNKPSREATGTASVSLVSSVVDEGQPIVIDVFWSGAELGDSVQVLTRKGTADIKDFRSSLRSVYYDGENDVSRIEIQTRDDSDFELDETMEIALVFPHGVELADNNSQEVIITSDEAGNAGLIEFSSDTLTLAEGDSGSLTLQRNGGSDGEFTVSVTTISGSADSNDFSEIDRKITFAEGETSKSINISARSDNQQESNESFTVRLTGHEQLIGDVDEVTVTIEASDAPAPETPNGGSDVERSGGSSGPMFLLLLLGMAATRFFGDRKSNQ